MQKILIMVDFVNYLWAFGTALYGAFPIGGVFTLIIEFLGPYLSDSARKKLEEMKPTRRRAIEVAALFGLAIWAGFSVWEIEHQQKAELESWKNENQKNVDVRQRILGFPNFPEIYTKEKGLGSPLDYPQLASYSAIYHYDHAIVIFIESLHKIIRLPNRDDPQVSFGDFDATSIDIRTDHFDPDATRRYLGDTFPRDSACKPPQGGVVELWKNTSAWRKIGCLQIACDLPPGKIVYQEFTNGYVFSAFPDAPRLADGITLFIDRKNQHWSESGHPSTGACILHDQAKGLPAHAP